MRLTSIAMALAAPAAIWTTASVASPVVDRWGLSADDWRTLDGPRFRAKLHFKERRAEIEQAAADGDVQAMTIMVGAILNGEVPGADPALAPRYAAAGDAAGILRARHALLLLKVKDMPLAEARTTAELPLLRLADAGFAPAMGGLAMFYNAGVGVAKDDAKSLTWARRGSEAGEPLSFYMLGLHYWEGSTAVAQDPVRAKGLMLQSAQAGYPEAMFWYGVALSDERFSPGTVDPAASTAWIGQAADRGSAQGRYYYALRLATGYGIAADRASAAMWYKRGADAGDANSQMALCVMYGTANSGVRRDDVAAARLCRQVIENANASRDLIGRAWYNVGYFSQVAGDIPSARASYDMARQLGFTDAPAAIAALDRQLAEAQAAAIRAEQAAQRTAMAARVQQAAIAARTAPNGAGGPSIDQIAETLARSSMHYFGGELTGMAGEQAYASPFGGVAYYVRRRITNVACTRLSAVAFRCGYDSDKQQVPASDSIWGTILSAGAAFTGANGIRHWTDTFSRTRTGWTSGTADTNNYQAALAQYRQRQAASQSASTSSDDGGRADRIRNCNNQVYGSLMSGDMSSAVAMSIVPCM